MKIYDQEETQLNGVTREYIVIELDYRELDIIDSALAEFQLQIGKRATPDKKAEAHMRAFRAKVEGIREPIFARVARGEKNRY